MLFFYNIAIRLYSLIIKVLSPFNNKAKLFVEGRQGIFGTIEQRIDRSKPTIWFHFASLGEFEQGRPVLESIKKKNPKKSIVITFFSPSGYEIRKNYALADGVFYLPLDTKNNAKKLIRAINPEMAIFTKYEYWYHYFKELYLNKIPIYIISGIFRSNQIYFKWYGSFNRKILSYVNYFFVQNEESKNLLAQINIKNVSVNGDTRFDRVVENAHSPKEIQFLRNFCSNYPVFIAGSTWPADERLLLPLISANSHWKFIIAPHEVHTSHIEEILGLIPSSVKYSELSLSANLNAQTLIIDNIGLLSSIYKYGKIAYIGGGFGIGIHNTLEAAAFGIPIVFGPKYEKFQEAKDLISLGAAKSINNYNELLIAFEELTKSQKPGNIAGDYVNSRTGSTDQIIDHILKSF